MKVIGVNGSPRKGWNTALLVEEALRGAASTGAETEIVHLYDMRFRGCISCFACKQKGGCSRGRCGFADELLPLLGNISRCDGLILGSPIYMGEVSASMRALIERLTFQYVTYNTERPTFFERTIPVFSIYTMNVSETQLEKTGYLDTFAFYEGRYTQLLGGPASTLICTETLQTDDYGQFEMSMFDEAARKKRRQTVFPLDLHKAFTMGAELILK